MRYRSNRTKTSQVLCNHRRNHFTVVKPFNPSPDTAFMQLLERHARAPVAIIASGATDWTLYLSLQWAISSYSSDLGRNIASDYGDSQRERTNRAYEQRRREALAKGQEPPTYEYRSVKDAEGNRYFGPAHGRVLELSDEFEALIDKVATKEVVPLHTDDDDDGGGGGDGKKHWLLEWYNFPLRPDLPARLNALAESLRELLDELVCKHHERVAHNLANPVKLPMSIA
ncbi:hypothetical protein B0T26DRAFT_755011 [Lasiosphaeria miniovina]|uniref:Uncharacterized protein n=1 Tax=Lasiosphaeria miniovina TaxID=1954250 RepID=A0AA40A5U5_9PEZI|nr:uncharacterized protein B0T26DRAFT_755011 [Lasiosphaeria miniovina]KAK0709869.1 hypothetical protein B0T26DRAFT_755011 [Lasiosphaeria miniovina]